jgi:hypothetical protein
LKGQLIQLLKVILPLGIGVYLTWYFYSTLSAEQKEDIPYAFASANYLWIILSIVVAWLSHFSRAYRWKYMLEPLGYNAKVSNMYHSVMIGYVINLTIPRSGEFARAGFFSKKENLPVETVFGTIVAERVIDVIMLAILTFATYFLVGKEVIEEMTTNPNAVNNTSIPWLYIVIGTVGILTLSAILISKKIKTWFIFKMKGLWSGIRTVFTLKKKFLYLAHTFFIWSCYVMMFWICAQGLKGVNDMSLETLLSCFIVGAVAIAATPGGIGLYPIFVTAALVYGKHDAVEASSFAILMWVVQTVFLVVFGLFSLFAINVKLKVSDVKINQ